MTIKIKDCNFSDANMMSIINISQYLYNNYESWIHDEEIKNIINNNNELYKYLKKNHQDLDEINIKSMMFSFYIYMYKTISTI